MVYGLKYNYFKVGSTASSTPLTSDPLVHGKHHRDQKEHLGELIRRRFTLYLPHEPIAASEFLFFCQQSKPKTQTAAREATTWQGSSVVPTFLQLAMLQSVVGDSVPFQKCFGAL